MDLLSVVIITFNEEEYIEHCLASVVDIADEILVLDSFSTDQTKEICIRYGARFEQHAFDGYVSQKNRALKMAGNDMILSLDADEALSDEAIREVINIKTNWENFGYQFKRRNNYCERWMRFTSLYPDRKIRLFDRRHAGWTGLDPHDYVQLDKKTSVMRLNGDIMHWVTSSKSDHEQKVEQFSTIAAQSYYSAGKRANWHLAALHAVWRFLHEYFIQLGFLEGSLGLQFSRLSAKYVLLKYTKLKELYANRH